jgi:hypothetical protein
LSQIKAAHEEVRAGKGIRVKGELTIKRLVRLAQSKGLIKARRG